MLIQNERPRYHYLDFPNDVRKLVPSIIDFKYYFSVSIEYLLRIRAKSFVCCLSELFREDLSQHFAGYLAVLVYRIYSHVQQLHKSRATRGHICIQLLIGLL